METVLDFVYTISESEVRHKSTFYHTYEFLLLVFLVFLMVGGDRYKWSQFSLVTEAIECKANIDFVVKCYYV